ncbi:MAG: hypothetical protein JWL81_1199 [Verrucomicrobiales bacterium]|nr:hypothetical protein [Verrucomicrobiales bacterium]
MLNDLEPAAASATLWSWKKILAVFLTPLVGFVVLLLLWDSKLETFPELTRHRRSMPPDADNGYLALEAKWSKLPEVDGEITQKWRDMGLGRAPWDDGFVQGLNPGARDLGADLKSALAAPDWMVPIRGEDDPKPSIPGGLRALRALAIQGLSTGHWEQTLQLVQLFHRLSRRQIQGANDGHALYLGCSPDIHAASLTAQLLAMAPLSAEAVERLRICWEADGISQSDLRPPAAGEITAFQDYAQGAADRLYLEGWRRWHFHLTYRENWTLNRMNRMLAAISLEGLATAPARETTLYAELDRVNDDTGRYPYLDLNLGGKLLTLMKFTGFYYGQHCFLTGPRQKLFAARAARVAVALKLWGRSHGDGMPVALEELVPDFLMEIPEDPWTGRPIQWDPVSRVLSAVGDDWVPDGPTAGEFSFSGLGVSAFGLVRFSLSRANAAPMPWKSPWGFTIPGKRSSAPATK